MIASLRDDAANVLLESSLDMPHGAWSGADFAYDRNGNQTRDLSRGVANIEYNALNLPARIEMTSGGTIEYLYTAVGAKLAEIVRDEDDQIINRRDYAGMFEYEADSIVRMALVSGYVTVADTVYHLYAPDYQGNIVAVYNTATGKQEHYKDYYPYGLPHAEMPQSSSILPGLNPGLGSGLGPIIITPTAPETKTPSTNRRWYSAKELTTDHGLNTYDFEARILTPAFPRFTTPDPLADFALNLTPYRVCFDDPINFIDPNGLFESYRDAFEYAKTLPTYAPPHFDYNKGEWYVPLNELKTDGYVSGGVLTQYYGPPPGVYDPFWYNDLYYCLQTIQPNTQLNNLKTKVEAFETASSVKQELIFWAARDANKRAGVVIKNDVKAVKVAFGKTMGNYSRVFHGLSCVSAGVVAMSAASDYIVVFDEGEHYERLIKPSIDVIMAGVGLLGGPIGAGISCSYFLLDLIYQYATKE